MTPLRFLSRREAALRIDGEGIYLRFPSRRDFEKWSSVRSTSRRFLEPWEPTWSRDDLTKRSFQRRIERYELDYHDGRAVPLFLFLSEDDQLIGGLNIGNIRRAAGPKLHDRLLDVGRKRGQGPDARRIESGDALYLRNVAVAQN